jgi:hypothetical protein
MSSRFSNKTINDTFQTNEDTSTMSDANMRADENEVGAHENAMEGIQKPPFTRRTRSRHDSLDGPESQESFERSIGTTSPLLIRLKEQRDKARNVTSHPQTQTQTTPQRKENTAQHEVLDDVGEPPSQEVVDQMERFLLNILQQMLDDHGLANRWILYDARMALREMNPKTAEYMEQGTTSPFTSLTSVHLPPGAPLPEGVPLDKMESYVSVLDY